MPGQSDNHLQKLKELLLHDEKNQLATLEEAVGQLRQTIEDKEALIASLDPVVADLLARKINSSKEEMAAALAPVMGEAIKQQIVEAKEDVVDALYPIIGQTIRKSVAEAMKRLVDSVNEKLDRALRQRLFSRKIKSKITGVSGGELLLTESFPCWINEVFLIHKGSGLLLNHVSVPNTRAKVNQELISGMLTAIRNFSSDIFKAEAPEEVHEIQYEDHKIKVANGRYYYLALVISGIESENLEDQILRLDRQIHNQFYKSLRDFSGDLTPLAGIDQPIKKFLKAANKPPKATPQSPFMLAYVIGFLILLAGLVAAAIFLPDYLAERSLRTQVYRQLEAFPEWTHLSLAAEISGGKLIVHGNVTTPAAKNQIDSVLQQVQGIRVENFVRVQRPEPELEQAIRRKLDGLARETGVTPQIIIEGDGVQLSGQVPSAAIRREIGYQISEVPGVRVVTNNLEISASFLDEYRKFFQQQILNFETNENSLSPDHREILERIAMWLRQHPEIRLIIQGYSDNLADSTYNLNISQQRARSVADYFQASFPADRFRTEFFGEQFPRAENNTPEGRAQNRRVEFNIEKVR